jgi:hypothetical protein
MPDAKRKIVRVFPRRTNASPTDELAYFGEPTMFVEADEVHISVTFTYDINRAEYLAEQWQQIGSVKLGGPAFNQPSGAFIPGLYLRNGYVITSRGCPNRCWFCSVWKREPKLIELPICDGVNVLDDNLLACSEQHIRNVFAMLKRQHGAKQFTGGLDAKLLLPWHIDLLLDLKSKQMFFSFDTKDDYEPLRIASLMLREAGFTRNQMRAYCLIGFPGDRFEKAEFRLNQCIELGFFPMAMLFRNYKGNVDINWFRFQKEWARPYIIATKIKLRAKGQCWIHR